MIGENMINTSICSWISKNCKFATTKKLQIDWDFVLRRINEGKTISAIAREIGASHSGLSRRIKLKFLDPNSPTHDAQIASKIRENERARWEDPEYKAEQAARMRSLWTPEFREAHENRLRQQWLDPAYREEQSKLMSEQARARWADPEYRAKKTEEMNQQWLDPAYRKRMMERQQMTDFWGWLANFPPEKQQEILLAIAYKNRETSPTRSQA
jgi:hypothetical protein